MENLDPTLLLSKLMDEYEQKFIANRFQIDRLVAEREVLQQQIRHLELLIAGHQELTQGQERLLHLVVPQPEPPQLKQQPASQIPTKLNLRNSNSAYSNLLKPEYQGMGILMALLEVIESDPRKSFTIQELSTAIFLPNRSQKTRSDLRNLISKELSRGVKEGKVARVEKMKGSYTSCRTEHKVA